MFISFSSKLLKYISVAASLFLGLKVDFGLKLFQSNCFYMYIIYIVYAYSIRV